MMPIRPRRLSKWERRAVRVTPVLVVLLFIFVMIGKARPGSLIYQWYDHLFPAQPSTAPKP